MYINLYSPHVNIKKKEFSGHSKVEAHKSNSGSASGQSSASGAWHNSETYADTQSPLDLTDVENISIITADNDDGRRMIFIRLEIRGKFARGERKCARAQIFRFFFRYIFLIFKVSRVEYFVFVFLCENRCKPKAKIANGL